MASRHDGGRRLLPDRSGLAQLSNDTVKVGVLADQSSIYSNIAGKGSIVAAKLAIEDFGKTILGRPVELVAASHQAKVDIGSSLVREMFNRDGVDIIVDISHSAVSLAVQEVARDANKVVMHVGSAHADLYGSACSPNGVLWLYDTYTLANGMALPREGGGRHVVLREGGSRVRPFHAGPYGAHPQ